MKDFSVGWWLVHVGELFGVLRGHRKININVNCIIPITTIYCMAVQFIDFILD